MRVRDIHSLFVSTPGGPFTLAVRKREGTSVADHLNNLAKSFVHKLLQRRACDCYSVKGSTTITEESADQIFAEVFGIPYEQDEEWKFALDNQTGCFGVVVPETSVVNTASLGTGRRSATTVSGTPRRTRDEVRLYVNPDVSVTSVPNACGAGCMCRCL